MEWLNFHHLLLFTTLVREGSLVAAGRTLGLSHSTLSSQIRAFEETLGTKLVAREGRRLVPTDTGRVVVRYGEEIFGLGRELLDSVRGGTGKTSRVRVGIVDLVPKLMVRRLLQPLLAMAPPVHIVCSEGSRERLLGHLALHEIDVVIADAPAESGGTVRAYNHLLGTCETSFFGAAKFERLRGDFPKSLDGEPMLLPLDGSPLRRALNVWFNANGIRPRVVGEFEDSALLKAMAQEGHGVFASPAAVEREVAKQYDVKPLGRVPEVREHFYAISSERRIKDPAIQAIFSAARAELFTPPRARPRS
jgi:LysR family transcriptional regulator, transcriptional activator of nhaA